MARPGSAIFLAAGRPRFAQPTARLLSLSVEQYSLATRLLTFRHAAISDIQLPAFTRHDLDPSPSPRPATRPRVLMNYDPDDSTSPSIAPRCFLARKTLRCTPRGFPMVMNGCELSRKDRGYPSDRRRGSQLGDERGV